jgi:hypothetical protein
MVGGEHEIHVLPCNSVSNVWQTFKDNLRKIASGVNNEVDQLLIFIDEDTVIDTEESRVVPMMGNGGADCSPPAAAFITPGSVVDLLTDQKLAFSTIENVADRQWLVKRDDQTEFLLALLHVRTRDHAACEGLPGKQTLERLVCRAIAQAYPDRSKAVSGWLLSRRDPPNRSPRQEAKEHAYSYLAGWYASDGCDYFFRHIWEQEATRTHLISELTGAGLLQIIESAAK